MEAARSNLPFLYALRLRVSSVASPDSKAGRRFLLDSAMQRSGTQPSLSTKADHLSKTDFLSDYRERLLSVHPTFAVGGEPSDVRAFSIKASDIRSVRPDGRCPLREGDACSLYAVRPLMCRAVPVDPHTPPAWRAAAFDAAMAGWDKEGFPCARPKDGDPVLLDGSDIVDAETAAAVSADWAQEKSDGRIAGILLGNGHVGGYAGLLRDVQDGSLTEERDSSFEEELGRRQTQADWDALHA